MLLFDKCNNGSNIYLFGLLILNFPIAFQQDSKHVLTFAAYLVKYAN